MQFHWFTLCALPKELNKMPLQKWVNEWMKASKHAGAMCAWHTHTHRHTKSNRIKTKKRMKKKKPKKITKFKHNILNRLVKSVTCYCGEMYINSLKHCECGCFYTFIVLFSLLSACSSVVVVFWIQWQLIHRWLVWCIGVNINKFHQILFQFLLWYFEAFERKNEELCEGDFH